MMSGVDRRAELLDKMSPPLYTILRVRSLRSLLTAKISMLLSQTLLARYLSLAPISLWTNPRAAHNFGY